MDGFFHSAISRKHQSAGSRLSGKHRNINKEKNTMKKLLSLLCALLVSAPLLASAADKGNPTGKNLCLLNSDNCASSEQSDSIQDTIAMLQHELAKGSAVYSADELRALATKLNEYQTFLAFMTSNA